MSDCKHVNQRFTVEETGEMRQRYTDHGYEVTAPVIGWSYLCEDCGVVVSTHGTVAPTTKESTDEPGDTRSHRVALRASPRPPWV
jgi:hypothetical protein